MFKKLSKDMANQTNQPGSLYNSLTAGSKIIGTIIADNDIRIDGTLEGELQCSGKLIIGEKGFIKGTVSCLNAEIQGKIEGKLTVKQVLTLRATSKIQGEVETQTLIIEANATFNGTCSMGQQKVAAPQK